MDHRSWSGPRARILVVEDFDALRTLMIRVLTLQGHEVLGVATASGALRLSASEHFDLLITTDEVPGGGGADIARRVVADHPEIRVVLVWGSPRDALDPELPGVRVTGFLEKPFGIDELALRVQQVLAAPPGGPAAPARGDHEGGDGLGPT